MDPSELIAMIKAGDRAAPAALVSLLAAELDEYSRFIAKELGDLEREGAVDNAMVRLVKRIDFYDPAKGTMYGWARAFVRFELADLYRRTRETPTEQTELDNLSATPLGDATDPDQPINPRGLAIELILNQLSDADQALFMMHEHEGLTFSEIAEVLGPPARADALRKRYQRARNKVIAAARTDPDLKHLTDEDTR